MMIKLDRTRRSMFRNVVASMNEALDISMHLKPLASHFQVVTDVNDGKDDNGDGFYDSVNNDATGHGGR